MTEAIILFCYIAGYLLSYQMLKVEHLSEGGKLTIGARAVALSFSILSWLAVIITLASAWVQMIGKTGYWSRPVKEPKTEGK